jgi:hypothetical protein
MTEIIANAGWLRIVKYNNAKDNSRYKVQLKTGFFFPKWRDVCFGPYGPYQIGTVEFTIRSIAEELYEKCREKGYSYTKRGVC